MKRSTLKVTRLTVRCTVWLSSALAALSLLLMVVIIVSGVAGRVFLGSPLVANHEELSGYLLVAFVFFGLPASFHSGVFVRVSAIFDKLARPSRRILTYGHVAVTAAYLITLAYFAWERTLMSKEFGSVSVGGSAMPIYVPQMAVAAGCTLFVVYVVAETITDLLRPGDSSGLIGEG